jgi:hypothetical protein
MRSAGSCRPRRFWEFAFPERSQIDDALVANGTEGYAADYTQGRVHRTLDSLTPPSSLPPRGRPPVTNVSSKYGVLRAMVDRGKRMTRPQLLRRLGAGVASGSPLHVFRL